MLNVQNKKKGILKKILVVLGSTVFFLSVFRSGTATETKAFLTYILSPITNDKILPTTYPIPGDVSDTISIIACPGEYEPASFVIHTFTDLTSLWLEPSDLKLKKGEETIPSSCIDIKIVKSWYQSGEKDILNEGKKFLLPELLLNDDSLVRVDTKEEENYLKLSFPEGEKYVCISKKEGFQDIPAKKGRWLTAEEFPVKDSPVLLPVNIPKDTNKQFWVTVKVPDNASAGTYTGDIKIRTKDAFIGDIKLRVKVLPFKLSQPCLTYSIFYSAGIEFSGKGSISDSDKNEEQLRKELEDLKAHGISNPVFQQRIDVISLGKPKYLEAFEKHLKMREEIFGKGLPLYCAGFSYWSSIPIDMVKKVIGLVKPYGISEVYFYGIDEAREEKLISQRDSWKAVHEAGGKVFVAGYAGTFEAMGDLLDLFVASSGFDPKEALKWHSVGRKIFSYANPQCGIENPLVYRRNYGLGLWQADYDGAMDYAYQAAGDGTMFWNDFDNSVYRDIAFAYPTVDGVIDTIQWEGWREGVDDVRYLTTLLEFIGKSKNSTDSAVKEKALNAEEYIRNLKETPLSTMDLDLIRLEMIQYILELTQSGGRP